MIQIQFITFSKIAVLIKNIKKMRSHGLEKSRQGPYPQNHKPISLLNTRAKICESVILEQLEHFSIKNKVIPADPFGTRQKHWPVNWITRVVEYILRDFRRKQANGSVFLDIVKVFDKIWHMG